MRALLLALAVFAVYLPALRGGFIWDDGLYLTENELISARDGLWRFWFSREAVDYYPLSSTSLWLEWRLWENCAPPYHVTNVAIHVFNSLLFVAVLRRMSVRGAWLAGFAFALHPVCVEAAGWIAQRKSLLAVGFFFASLLCWLIAEERKSVRSYVAALVFFAASLLSKTCQVTLPVLLLLLAWWRSGGIITRRDVARSIPFFAVAAAAGAATIWFQQHHAIAGTAVHPEGPMARLASAGWTFLFYLRQALAPVHLAVCHPRWSIDPSIIAHWIPLLVALLIAIALWFVRDAAGRHPLFVAYSAFAICLLPVFGFLDIGFMQYSLVADHWQYGALPALLAVAGAGLSRVGDVTARRAVFVTIAAAWICALGFLAHGHARAFASEENLWRDNIAKYPQVSRGWSGLGGVLLARGAETEAIPALGKALDLNRDDPWAHARLGWWLVQRGETTNSVMHLQNAVRLMPGNSRFRYGLGLALTQAGRHREAAREFETLLAASSGDDASAFRLAWLLAVSDDVTLRNPARSIQLAGPRMEKQSDPSWTILDIWAAVLAAQGRHADAAETAAQAGKLAEVAGLTNVVPHIRKRLEAYRAGRDWREHAVAAPGN